MSLQQVNSVHYDTKPMEGAPSKHIPLLHTLKNKDPVEIENFRQVAVVGTAEIILLCYTGS